MDPQEEAAAVAQATLAQAADAASEGDSITAPSVGDVPTPLDSPRVDDLDSDDLRRAIARERLRAEYLSLRERNRIAQEVPHIGFNRDHAGGTPGIALETRESSLAPTSAPAAPESVTSVEAPAIPLRRPGESRSRKQPDIPTFYGKDLQDAKLFIYRLELAFLNNPAQYLSDSERITQGLTWLKGDAEAKAMRVWDASAIATGTWLDFREFIMNTVTDPANRELSLMLRYERATQSADQSVATFASLLDGLEKEFDEPYSEAQSRRHLLAKLRPSLRDAIVRQAYTPQTREELISFAERIENSMPDRPTAGNKRHAGSSQADRNPKRQRPEREEPPKRKDHPSGPAKPGKPPNPCIHCGGDHWNRDCTKRDASNPRVQRVELSNPLPRGKARRSVKSRN